MSTQTLTANDLHGLASVIRSPFFDTLDFDAGWTITCLCGNAFILQRGAGTKVQTFAVLATHIAQNAGLAVLSDTHC